MANLNELYKQWCGEEPASLEKIEGSGSNRQYYRIHGSNGQTVIGVIGTSRDEDHALFICQNILNAENCLFRTFWLFLKMSCAICRQTLVASRFSMR